MIHFSCSKKFFQTDLNLKRLNEFLLYVHFKIDSEFNLTMIHLDCYMAKVNAKEAYYSVPILSGHQKYLKFLLQANLHQFTCLPNGLPWIPEN